MCLGSNGSLINELNQPRGLALNPISGELYIVDYNNHRVVGYLSGTPNLVAGGNGPGSLSTQLYYPAGLTFDVSSNSLYILNQYGHTVVRWILGASTWTAVAGSPGAAGYTPFLLSYPIIFTINYIGNLYVVNNRNHRIQLFLSGTVNGTTIAGVTGVGGNAPHLLNSPYDVALDSDLNLYVADFNNHRIQKFLRY